MRLPLTSDVLDELAKHAQEAAARAYAPYSAFHVGAAVRTTQGRIYVGANVENASYGLSLCAERAALANALAAGERSFAAIAVACVNASSDSSLGARMPCGACRQWLVELAPDAVVVIVGTDEVLQVHELLPYAFTLRP